VFLDQIRELQHQFHSASSGTLASLRDLNREEQARFDGMADALDNVLLLLVRRLESDLANVAEARSEFAAAVDAREQSLSEVFANVDETAEQAKAAAHTAATQVDMACDSIEAAIEQGETAAITAEDALAQGSETWSAACASAMETSRQESENLAVVIGVLSEQRDARFADLAVSCRNASQAGEALMQGLESDWSQRVTELARGADQMLIANVGVQLGGEVRSLLDSLASLRREADRVTDMIEADIGDLVHDTRQIMELVEKIEPLLRVVDELL
jgi:hypothetical protein